MTDLPAIEPDVCGGIPFCSERCPQHDGKRCRILGLKPGNICEPGVSRILEERDAALARIASLDQSLGNLLAQIHGDGGQHCVEHGLEKSCADAHEAVAGMRERIAELERKITEEKAVIDLVSKMRDEDRAEMVRLGRQIMRIGGVDPGTMNRASTSHAEKPRGEAG